ncbi:MAG: hypothetical protein KGI51_07125 [Rhodospirillales bacterium]|nr:hypothetical protein [Rhodospirillales bacterium]
MSLSTPIGSLATAQTHQSPHPHRRRDGDFTNQLTIAGANRPVGSGGPGALLSSSLLQQLQGLTAATGSARGLA